MDVEENPAPSSISTTWLLVYTALALFVVHQLYTYTHFWRLGIRGPIPLPLVGNLIPIFSGVFPSYVKWEKKYGKLYGIYFAKQPCLRTADADLAKQILIKEFPSFPARNEQTFEVPYFSDSLLTSKGEKWKTSRGHMSPTFSGSKMKQMIPNINRCCDVLMEVLDKKQKEGESFELKYVYGSYVLDCVACCAFGLNAECQTNPDDPFLKHSKRVSNVSQGNIGMLLRVFFPFLSPLLDKFRIFDMFPRPSLDFFADVIKRAMELRKETSGTSNKDFLQLMMDAAEMGGEDEAVKSTNDADKDETLTSGEVKKKTPMTQKELIGQSMIFFFAGYDTVSTTLTFVSYALGRFPEVQRKLQEEIDEMIPEDKPVGYDVVFKMEYLEKVFCESQRMWPMAFALERTCNQDFNYQGLTIPNGQYVQINVWDIQRNPEYWPEPDRFNPENFSKEARESRHPCAYLPFGAGPRNCVGMRFAILESKIALIRILQKYSFEIPPEQPDLCDYKNLGKIQLYPKPDIRMRVVPRD